MFTVQIAGSIQGDPKGVTTDDASSQTIDIGSTDNFDGVLSAAIPINSSTMAPFVPALGTLAAVRLLAVRAVDGQSLTVLISSSAGSNQAIPVSDQLVLRAKNPGQQITAVGIVGVGRIEYLIGGNVS